MDVGHIGVFREVCDVFDDDSDLSFVVAVEYYCFHGVNRVANKAAEVTASKPSDDFWERNPSSPRLGRSK